MAQHSFNMVDTGRNDGAVTTVGHSFETDTLHDLVEEFKYYLWHSGFDYVADLEVIMVSDPRQPGGVTEDATLTVPVVQPASMHSAEVREDTLIETLRMRGYKVTGPCDASSST